MHEFRDTPEALVEQLFDLAWQRGARAPALADASGEIVICDLEDSELVFRVTLERL